MGLKTHFGIVASHFRIKGFFARHSKNDETNLTKFGWYSCIGTTRTLILTLCGP